jgi:hypothetical protein
VERRSPPEHVEVEEACVVVQTTKPRMMWFGCWQSTVHQHMYITMVEVWEVFSVPRVWEHSHMVDVVKLYSVSTARRERSLLVAKAFYPISLGH